MKKYIAIVAALAAVVLPSCTNDDIIIEDTAKFELNVSTQSVYDDFEIADAFKSRFLGGKGYSIGVYSYIYDTAGNLAASDSLYTETFGKVTQDFSNLKAGDYTLVTLEMIVENEDDYKSPNWLIAGQNNLETLAIYNKDYRSYWYSAVGLYRDKITVGKGNVRKDVTPKGIGCVVDTYMFNLNNTNFVYSALFTKEQPVGRKLSPNYSGEERFIYYEYNESNIWTARGYVYDTSGLENEENVTIYLLEEGNIKYLFGGHELNTDGSINLSIKGISPSNNAVVRVYDGSSLYAGYNYNALTNSFTSCFGTESVFDNWFNQNVDLNSTPTTPDPVNPLAYDQPYLTWGANYTTVDNYMSSKGMTMNNSYSNSENFWTVYFNKAETVNYQYYFNTSKNNLEYVVMEFDVNHFSVSSVNAELKKTFGDGNYTDTDTLKGYLYYNTQTIAFVFDEVSDGAVTVMYVPNTSSNAPAKISQLKKQHAKRAISKPAKAPVKVNSLKKKSVKRAI